jgi:microcystin-dependent protein
VGDVELKKSVPQDRSPAGNWYGRIATDAVDINDPVEVVIPAFSEDLRWGPCRWQARGDNILPARDDEALVTFDNLKNPWIGAWWPNRAVTEVPVSELAPGLNGQFIRTAGGVAVWQDIADLHMSGNLYGGETVDDFGIVAGNGPDSVFRLLTFLAGSLYERLSISSDGVVHLGGPTNKAQIRNAVDYVISTYDQASPGLSDYGASGIDKLAVFDTRAVDEAPGINGRVRCVRADFKQRTSIAGAPGTGTYGILLTLAPWTQDDSGGGVKQLWIDDSNPPKMYIRRGSTVAGTWGAWTDISVPPDGSVTIPKLASTVTDVFAPIGSILGWGGASDPSTTWLLCDGRSLLRASYPTLFTNIGTVYGSVDGTHFNIPDFRGRVAVMVDGAAARLVANDTLGASGGEELHALTTAELAAHAHNIDHAHQLQMAGSAGGNAFAQTSGGTVFDSTNGSPVKFTSGLSSGNAGSGTAHNNMMPFLVVNKIIRAL